MPTLLLPPRYTPDSIALWQAASCAGWTVRRVHGWKMDEGVDSADVALYGETFFTAVVAGQLGIALLEPPLDWLVQLPLAFIRRRMGWIRLEAIGSLPFPMFVKPADGKSFPAGVYDHAADVPMRDGLPGSTKILWSEPVFWELEVRSFIREGEICAMSLYARDGEYVEEDAAADEIESARELLAALLHDESVPLPPAVVVDVGRIRGRGWAVVEANPCWSAGLYRCDPGEVLLTVARACVSSRTLTEADQAWIIERGSGE